VVDITPVLHLSITESQLVMNINCKVMLLQHFCHMSDIKRILHVSVGQCSDALSFFLLSSLQGDVTINAEASSGPSAQPHVPYKG